MGGAASQMGVGPYRFEAELGRGASGIVYRASDPNDPAGHAVAVKVLHAHLGDEELRERFRREAEVGIDHPNVVKVLAAGVGEDDVAYIAFERLVGESLEDRLRRGPLDALDLIEVGRQAATGLAAAHSRGIVHRDLKPANLFLTADGQVKLLDFGVALATSRNTRVTQAATIMGTPAYLSPEQTRAISDLDARTDLWSLGAILYEAATGKMAFGRDTMFATLVAIRKDEAPPLQSLAPGLPRDLVTIIERCLQKDRDQRWPSAQALVDALSDVKPARVEVAPDRAETRVIAVLMAHGLRDGPALKRAIEAQGGVYKALPDGRAIGLFGLKHQVGNEAQHAIRAGLDARPSAASMAVTSGEAIIEGKRVSGHLLDVVDRGCRQNLSGLAIDRELARTLDARTAVRIGDGEFAELTAKRLSTQLIEVPRAMGKSPLVGRDAELATLLAGLERARSGETCAFLLSGPSGIGKTRLRDEVERAATDFAILSARGEPHRYDEGFSLMAALVRSRLRERSGRAFAELTTDERRREVESLVQSVAPPGTYPSAIIDALLTLLGVEGASVAVTRRDLPGQHERVRAGLAELFANALAVSPVALMIEEVQWADTLSLDLLSELASRPAPLFLLMTSRDELDLSARFALTAFPLSGLAANDVSRLVYETIGRRLPDTTLRSLTQHTSGNPLFVEQIVAALGDRFEPTTSGSLPLPLSVRAAVQSRMAQLRPEDRALCQHLAIFERPFYTDELDALGLGDVSDRLLALTARGVLAPRGRPHPQRGRPYHFAQPILHEVARGMLTDEVRAELHARLAEYLATHAEVDTPPEEIAFHYERAGLTDEAAVHYRDACLRALRAGDATRVLSTADSALSLGLPSDEAFAVHMARAQALGLEGRQAEHDQALRAAMGTALTQDDRSRVQCERAWVAMARGDLTRALRLANDAETAARGAHADRALALALGCKVVVLARLGDCDEAESVLYEALALSGSFGPELRARAATWRGELAAARGDLGEQRQAAQDAIALAAEAGDLSSAAGAAVELAQVHLRFGLYDEAIDELRAAIHDCRQAGNRRMEGHAWVSLASALADVGRTHEAHVALDEGQRLGEALGETSLTLMSRIHRAALDAHAIDAEAAATDAPDARLKTLALGVAARAWVASGDGERALERAREAMALRDAVGHMPHDALLFTALVEALEASSQPALAEAARAEGLHQIEAIAGRIADPTWRDQYRDHVLLHRTLRG